MSETKKYEKNTQNEKFSDTNAARAVSVGIVEECGANGERPVRGMCLTFFLFPMAVQTINVWGVSGMNKQ